MKYCRVIESSFSASLFQTIVDHYMPSGPISAASSAATDSASTGMSLAPLDQRPGVLQDHRPFYDDPPPRIGSGDFLASEQPAPFTNPFRRLSRPQATLHQRVHSLPTSSDLRPLLRPRGQRGSAHLRSGPQTLRSATAATSSRSSTDTIWRTAELDTFAPASTEEKRGCLSKPLLPADAHS